MLLNNVSAKEAITRKIFKYFEQNENENIISTFVGGSESYA